MEFTGEFATYYKDICKSWNAVVAKCKVLEEKDPWMHDFLDLKIKLFDKEVTEFNGTTILDKWTMSVCGKKKYIHSGAIHEPFIQLRCI